MFRVYPVVLSVHCSLVVTCWERTNLLALLYVTFSCVFVTEPCGVLGQVWYLIVSIPDICLLHYFVITCLERADLLAHLCVVFPWVFVTFTFSVSGRMWYLLVSIPDLCLLLYVYPKCKDGIQTSILRFIAWHHEAYRVMTNGDREGQIFLSHSHSPDRCFCSLFNIAYFIFQKKFSEDPKCAAT